jgi:hypothetical protein
VSLAARAAPFNAQIDRLSVMRSTAKNFDLHQSTVLSPDVRFGSKPDVTLLNFDVRFTPESGHGPIQL